MSGHQESAELEIVATLQHYSNPAEFSVHHSSESNYMEFTGGPPATSLTISSVYLANQQLIVANPYELLVCLPAFENSHTFTAITHKEVIKTDVFQYWISGILSVVHGADTANHSGTCASFGPV